MSHVKQYLATMAQRKQRAAQLVGCLVGNQQRQYMWHRLRYYALKLLLTASLHAVEYLLIFIVFSYRIAASILVFRIVGFIITGAWWGLLESMREKVRVLALTKNKTAIVHVVVGWLIGSVIVGSLILFACATWIGSAMMHLIAGQWLLFDFYLFAIVLQTLARLFVLTLHSGIFAIQRVYRPLFSILISPVVGLCILLLLWPWWRGFSLPMAALSEALLGMWLTAFYSLRMLKKNRIHLELRLPWSRLRHAFSTLKNSHPWLATVAGVVVNVEGLLILLLITSRLSDGGRTFNIVYLLAPIIMACSTWPKVFYFDYKKNSDAMLRLVMRRLQFAIECMTPVLVFLLFALAAVLLYFILQINGLNFYLSLVLFLLTRSLLCQRQIQFYAYRSFGTIIIHSAVLLLLVWFLDTSISRLSEGLLVLSALQLLQFISLVFIYRGHSGKRYQETNRFFYPWIQHYFRADGHHYEFKRALLSSDMTHTQATYLTEKMNVALQSFGHAHLVSKDCIVYYEIDDGDRLISAERLSLESLGQVVNIDIQPFLVEDYRPDLHERLSLLPLRHLEDYVIKDVIALFQRIFPEAAVLDYANQDWHHLSRIAHNEWHQVWKGLMAYLEAPLMSLKSKYVVSALVIECVQVVFVVPKGSENTELSRSWGQWLHYYNLRRLGI